MTSSQVQTGSVVERESSTEFSTRIPWLLIGLGALLRIVSFPFSANTGGDAWARLQLTALWLQHPTFKVVYDAYLPGHFWLIGFLNLFLHNLVLSGRLLSLLLGVGTLYFLWRLTRAVYGSASGVFALAIFAFYTLHIGYSGTSSAEVPYLFFLIAGMAFFFDYFRDDAGSLKSLVASGLCISVAESIRLEAWVIFFAMGVAFAWLTYRRLAGQGSWFTQWWKPVLVLALAGGAWPIFSMIFTKIAYGDAMRVLSLHNTLVTGRFKLHPEPLSYQLGIFPGALLIALSPWAVLAGIYGFWRSWFFRLGATFAAIVLFFTLIQNYEIVVGKLLAMARYSLTIGTFLTVLAGYGFDQLVRRYFPQKRQLVLGALIVLLALNCAGVWFLSRRSGRVALKFASVSPCLRYAPTIVGVKNFLAPKLGPNDAVVIDDYNVESNVVAQAVGLPLLPGNRAFLANAKNDVTVEEYIARQKPRYLIYSDQGTLQESIKLPATCNTTTVGDVDYACKFQNQIYRIYELSYQPFH